MTSDIFVSFREEERLKIINYSHGQKRKKKREKKIDLAIHEWVDTVERKTYTYTSGKKGKKTKHVRMYYTLTQER